MQDTVTTLRRGLVFGAIVLTIAVARATSQSGGACGEATHPKSAALAAYAKRFVSLPAFQRFRDQFHVPTADSSSVRIEAVDSLCVRASALISQVLNEPESTARRIYLVKAGEVFFAEDPKVKSGEWTKTYVIDSSMTRILSSVGR
ncbi:MAG: hypothetical protein V4558_06355 [Gemmatimonadota bacterium]